MWTTTETERLIAMHVEAEQLRHYYELETSGLDLSVVRAPQHG